MTTQAAKSALRSGYGLLGVYLNDHLAGATAGMGLARRMAKSADPGSGSAATLRTLAGEIADDRSALMTIMTALGIRIRGYKVFGAWAGEKAGILKLNGRLLTRSPLSDLEEAEVLRLGVEGKAAGWRTLRVLADGERRLDAARLDELLERAARQSATLETLRISAADRVLSDRGD
jgi:hypothetical protein